MFWGLSPALDLQEEYIKETTTDFNEINILTIGACDARHILKTLAQSYRHKRVNINIHVVEGCSELIARQILLLAIALENPKTLGLQEKSRFFMEIYGNTLLRSSTSKNLMILAKHLIDMITNVDYMGKMMPLINIDKLKYKERDYIEILMKFWNKNNSKQFDICYLWDRRVRHYLGVRYDSRLGAFDWDYNMRLRDLGGSIVNSQEFKHFRSTGVAFTWLETEVCRPNMALVAGVLTNGDQFINRGYLGDIVTGPYIAYSLNCEDENMMKTNNGLYFKRATDITERNVMRMLYELQFGESFNPESVDGDANQNLGMVTLAAMDAKLSEQSDFEFSNIQKEFLPCIPIEHAKVHFHSLSALDLYPEKEAYMNKFQIVFVSYNFSKRIKPSLMKMMDNRAIILIEGCKFILDMKKDNINEFAKDIDKIASDLECTLVNSFDPLKDSFAKLIRK